MAKKYLIFDTATRIVKRVSLEKESRVESKLKSEEDYVEVNESFDENAYDEIKVLDKDGAKMEMVPKFGYYADEEPSRLDQIFSKLLDIEALLKADETIKI